jgi:hypothetical protein
MLDLFRAGEVIAPGRTNEEEIKLLKTETPQPNGGQSLLTSAATT